MVVSCHIEYEQLIDFAYKALVSRPSLDQCAVNTEVIFREQFLTICFIHDLVEKFNSCFVRNQPFAVLGKNRGNPHNIFHR